MRKLKISITGILLFLNTVFWVVPIVLLAVLKLLLPIPLLRRWLTWALMKVAENWISCNALIFGSMNSTRWQVEGVDGLSMDEWYLMMVNHQSWVDIVVLQTVFNRRIPLLKFFIKKQLMWFPFLGVAFWALDMPFMQRHSKSYLAKHPEKKGSDLEVTRRACEKFRHTPTSVINFVEGTRFSEEKRDRKQSPYRHLLTPRAGGVALAISSMGEMFSSILDVTIVYPDGRPRFSQMMCGEFNKVVVKVRRLPVERWLIDGDYANDREFRRQFHGWLGAVWQEKDALLEQAQS